MTTKKIWKLKLLGSILIGAVLVGCSTPGTLFSTSSPSSKGFTVTPRPHSSQSLYLTTTPSSSPMPPATPTPANLVIDYPAYGFHVTLPAELKVFPQPTEGSLRLFLGFAWGSGPNPDYPLPPIGLRVFEKQASERLLDWFNQQQGDCYDRGATPPPGKYFIYPAVDNQEPFQGNPALHYTSNCWPVPVETVIDRGRWVIALYYLTDFPQDYEEDFDRMLASLELYDPVSDTTEVETPNSNERTLHLATFDGKQDIAFAQGEGMEGLGWAPDGFHFLFWQNTTDAPQLGSLCGGSQPLLDPPVFPVRDVQWVDAAHFLFVAGAYGDPNAELRLGEVGGGSILIGRNVGNTSYYQFVPDDAALGK